MKTTLLRNTFAAIAALFISMFALPQQAQAQNTVTIDGVEKPILSTVFSGGYHKKAFFVYLYLSDDKKEYVEISGNKDLHATYDYIDLTKKEDRQKIHWVWGLYYWGVQYTKNGNGNELFIARGDSALDHVVFTKGDMKIYGDPRPTRKVCGISLYSGEITDTKYGDGQKHTISIDYKHEHTDPTVGTLTVGTVTDNSIALSWTHGSDNITPQDKLHYRVEYQEKGESGWKMPHVGNATSYTVTGLKPSTEYHVNLLVQDESGNYKRYGKQTVTTKAESYGIKIAGVEVTSANSNNLSVVNGVSGTVSYKPTTNTLTLNNATIDSGEADYIILSENPNLQIKLIGTNTLKGGRMGAVRFNDGCPGKIFGASSTNDNLIMTNILSHGILVYAPVTITNCNIQIVSNYYGITGRTGKETSEKVVIEDCTLSVKGRAGSIADINTLTLEGCAITQPAGAAFDASLKGVALNGQIVTEKVTIEPVINYNLKIAGTQVTSANCADLSVIPGVSGTATYAPATKILALENATIAATGNNDGIWGEIYGLTVRVKGTVNVTVQEYNALGFRSPTTLTGGGTLNATGSICGIYVYNTDLTLDGLTVNAKGAWGIAGYSGSVETLTIRNATVTAEGNGTNGSLCDLTALTLDGCAINQPTGAAFDASLKGVALNGQIVKTKVTIGPALTAIEAPEAEAPLKKQGIYTLQGVKLQGTLHSLPPGIYIVDGRKVVKR